MTENQIEREIRIDASPEIVFDVVSNPAHVRNWWPEQAEYDAVPGGTGELVFHHEGEEVQVAIEVVDALPYRLFSFRWTQPTGDRATADNSFLVTFELEPDGDATVLRMTETGFERRGWDAATVQAVYTDHGEGWDHHLARLAPYVAKLQSETRR